jgi:D-glycero-D-manno-heptose 1,7-bisphosphate phosphatase
MQRAAVFLDRDGVINVDHGHVHRIKDFEFIDGAIEIVKLANTIGLFAFVVTNQGGIAKGLYGEKDFYDLSEWMLEKFRIADAKLDGVYHCPHHPEGTVTEYSISCECRKPKPGMILRAISEHNLSASRSIMIGNKPSDMWAGNNAGVRNLVLLTSPNDVSPANEKTPDNTISIESLYDSRLNQIMMTTLTQPRY